MTKFVVPDLKITPRDGGYVRGQEGLELILKSALKVLIEHGYQALTFRRIALECGMKLGNITYYFKSKDDLVRTLLDSIMAAYEDAFQSAIDEAGGNPEMQMENLMRFIMEDITSKKTTRVFPELWALSSHDTFVRDKLYELYARQYVYFENIIRRINPTLSRQDERLIAAFVTACMEGTTVFAGFKKPWNEHMPEFEDMACKSFVHLVKNWRSNE
ncbi:HTH-type transcriptional regulator BetI [compost metagenome]